MQNTHFKPIFRILLVASISFFFLFSCTAYESDFPLSDPDSSVDCSDLLGEWYALKKVKGEMKMIHSIDISPLSNFESIIKATWFSLEDNSIQETNNYRIFKSRIDTSIYLNIQPINNDEKKSFVFWKYDVIKDDMIKGYYLGPRFMKQFDSKESLNSFAKSNQENFDSYFDTLQLTYVRSNIYSWDILNEGLKLDKLESMEVLKEDSIRPDFESLALNDLVKLPSKSIDKDKIREAFSDFHFVAGPKPMFESNPKMAYFKFNNGDLVKLIIYKSGSQIFDVQNRRLYKLDERKKIDLSWLLN